MRHSRAPRVARGVVGASVATFAALMSHVSAGGGIPGWVGLVVPWVLAVTVCTLLAGRKLSVTRLSISVIVSQMFFHGLFVLGAPSAGVSSVGHQHHGGMVMTPAPSSVTEALCADPLMWAAHAFAAVVTIAALYRGERACRGLLAVARDIAAWAYRNIARVLTLPVFSSDTHAVVAEGIGWFVRAVPHLTVLRRRGPPSLIVL